LFVIDLNLDTKGPIKIIGEGQAIQWSTEKGQKDLTEN
jgi:hypothetical protein